MVSGRKIQFAGKSFRKCSQAQRAADIIVRDGKWKINEHNFFWYGNKFFLIETVRGRRRRRRQRRQHRQRRQVEKLQLTRRNHEDLKWSKKCKFSSTSSSNFITIT